MECSECTAILPAEARFCLQCGARVQAVPDPIADPLRDALERAIGFQYRIERLLGRGGMGAVYLAHELALDRDVAIKVLTALHSNDLDRLRRFEQEARAAGQLNHPNILTVHAIGHHDGAPYLVTELLEGETLHERLSAGALSPRIAIDIAIQITRGLAAAHERGIVHRDLKPANVFLGKGRSPRKPPTNPAS
jgi:serine/threonine protein kinase